MRRAERRSAVGGGRVGRVKKEKIPPLFSAWDLHAVPALPPHRGYAVVRDPPLRLLYEVLFEHLEIVVDYLIPPFIPLLGLSSGSGTLDPLDQRGPQATRHLSLAFDSQKRKQKPLGEKLLSRSNLNVSM